MVFTVLMPVHDAIQFDIFKKSVNSVINNTLLPSEFLIVVDGNISSQKRIFLKKIKKKNKFINIVFKNKLGLVKILNYGLKIAKYKLIARADADDINHKNRFFEQVNFFKTNKVDILGSNINENINGKEFIKKVPKKPSLFDFCFLNPINHMTVMFNRDKIIKLGSYPNIKYKEDYALWFLAKIRGYAIANLDVSLVNSRIDSKTMKRRKNFQAIFSEFRLFFFLIKKNIFLIFVLSFSLLFRIFFLILPNSVYLFFLTRINRFGVLEK
jgi:amylovoran biosynthesis glycosyltransferase AmsE